MPSLLLPIFKRKLYSLLRKWQGVVKQVHPFDVPNLLMLLQILGFKSPDRFETENTISVQIHCNHHPNRVYVLEIPVKQGWCNCIKHPEPNEATNSRGGIVWRTRQVFPLRDIKQDIQEYARLILTTFVELIIRVTHPREEVHRLIGKHVDFGLIVDSIRAEDKPKASDEVKLATDVFTTETLTQMAQYLKHAMCFIDMTLTALPENIRNTDKTLRQTWPKKGSFRLARSPKASSARAVRAARALSPLLLSTTSESDNPDDDCDSGSPSRSRMEELITSFKKKFKS